MGPKLKPDGQQARQSLVHVGVAMLYRHAVVPHDVLHIVDKGSILSNLNSVRRNCGQIPFRDLGAVLIGSFTRIINRAGMKYCIDCNGGTAT